MSTMHAWALLVPWFWLSLPLLAVAPARAPVVPMALAGPLALAATPALVAAPFPLAPPEGEPEVGQV